MLAERQDRNTFLTDGAFWSWDAGLGQLTWTANALLRVGGLGSKILAPTTLAGLNATGMGAYIDANRTAAGPEVAAARDISSASNNDDNVIYFGVRGADSKFYLIDGTVIGDGETRVLGGANVMTDRDEITSDGRLTGNPYVLAFNFAYGSNQLAIFVGGMLQIEGTHYDEVGPGPVSNSIDFKAGYEPSIGELITAINVAGGQGPPGAGVVDLQGAYDGNREIETAGAGLGVSIHNDDDLVDDDVVLECGQPSSPDLYEVLSNGDVRTGQAIRLRVPGGGNDDWELRIDDTDDALVIYNRTTNSGVRIPAAGGIEHGTMAFPVFTGKGELAWEEFSGTLDNIVPESIPTTIDGSKIKGIILAVENDTTGFWQMHDIVAGNAVARAAFAFHDGANPATISIAGNSSGTTPVGDELKGHGYTLTVFYETA